MKRNDINFLKSIAIVAVILFHIDLLKNGYLGVDIFLVIAGFLTTKSLINKSHKEKISYKKFLSEKVIRLVPLLLAGTLVTFLIPCFLGMLPDNFENIAESIVASNLFSNNILSVLTTKNYWDISNLYKPLYHLWYVAILFKFYLLYPLLIKIIQKFSKKEKMENNLTITLIVISVISLTLYLLPSIPYYYKFYLFIFRLFEFGIGGLCYCFSEKIKIREDKKNIIGILLRIGLLTLILMKPFSTEDSLSLILTVCLTSFILILNNQFNLGNKVWTFISEKTYSFYIWHQIIFAFYRCYVDNITSLKSITIVLIMVVAVSLLSYYLIERKVKNNKGTIMILILGDCIITILAFLIYLNAGVVQDIPELDIEKNNIKRGMHAEYCDRIYSYNKDFENNDKLNILIIGNSYARDFANVILESNYSGQVNIQYHANYISLEKIEIIKSDYIFIYGSKKDIPKNLRKYFVNDKTYGIGVKYFGENNERFYLNRNNENYFKQSFFPTEEIIKLNNQYEKEWKNNYVNILEIIENVDGSINVFTDNNKFISQDCKHLTKNGAQYLAKLINFDWIFRNGKVED